MKNWCAMLDPSLPTRAIAITPAGYSLSAGAFSDRAEVEAALARRGVRGARAALQHVQGRVGGHAGTVLAVEPADDRRLDEHRGRLRRERAVELDAEVHAADRHAPRPRPALRQTGVRHGQRIVRRSRTRGGLARRAVGRRRGRRRRRIDRGLPRAPRRIGPDPEDREGADDHPGGDPDPVVTSTPRGLARVKRLSRLVIAHEAPLLAFGGGRVVSPRAESLPNG